MSLEALHARVGKAMMGVTMMITRRRFSPSLLTEVIKELRDVADAMEKFIHEKTKS